MTRDEKALRTAMIAKARWMNSSGLNQGTSGNISARYEDVMLITPSATPYDGPTPEMIAAMPPRRLRFLKGPLRPSTEWRFHLDIIRSDPTCVIVHTHLDLCDCAGNRPQGNPRLPLHDGGFRRSDRGAPGARTAKTVDFALKALEGRNGCILANHGMIALGANLDKAMWLAVELETIARQYYLSLVLGNPVILSDEQIEETARGLATYGLQDPPMAKRSATGSRRLKRVN